jgi:UDP:flavonoid glycosyltransferase YjiC (YdhE family)
MMRIPVVLMLNQFRVEIIRRPSQKQLSVLDRLFFLIANLGWLFVRTAIQLVWGRSQVILIPDLPAPYTISQGNLAIPRRYNSKVKLVGPIVEAEFSNIHYSAQQLRRRLGVSTKKPVIYAAVSGPKIEREVLTRILVKALGHAARRYTVILSKGNPDGSTLRRKSKSMLIFDWILRQDDLIKASDIVVSRAGHGTIMKSIVYGKPMILVPIPDHTEQYANARRAEVLGIAKVIDQNKLSSRTLDSAISDLLSDENYRKEARRIQKSVSSMQAVKIACDLIEDLASAPREISRLPETQPSSNG